MNIDDLRTQWNSLSVRVDRLEQENRRLAAELATGRATTAQQRLSSRYIKHGLMGLLLPLLAPMIVYVLEMPVWVAVLYAIFGLICMTTDFAFSQYIKRTNFAVMPVVVSLENMLNIKKRQRQIQLVFIILGLLFLGLAFFPAMADRPPLLIGGLVGLVFGLFIGLREYRQKVKLINEVLSQLRESINPHIDGPVNDL